ncbi:hypothetical protein SARC_08233 [Sphaeroforma arctica JP610]|uniref:FYVE-type domain-containing protein n=1 Tax=Sphaeroforma arctica JP610 TaxID=667725 RepID=A0A0L0FRQ3_9EUKA|nr:hypothetical protein SARC_08233 [Sphaeroforma arctica JP610]KNC79369.1 hypothetical protein SARC_08233 [Sphaeroforma arctica JP610]|eukprot:XP_014153271.1 hypothetical protein SARC_08233 [Sphaeroforma arctica JP610]
MHTWTRCICSIAEAGADVNLPNAVGKTPLITAATEGDARIVKLLLDNGADPMITDKMGRTPAEMAKKYAHTEVLELFPEEARPALTLEEIMANFNKAALSATSTPPPTQTPPPEASPEDIPQDPSSDPQRDTTVQEAEGSHGTTQPTAENSGGESTGCAATDIDPTAQDKGQLPGAEAPPPTPAQVHSGSERDTPVSTVTVEAADEPTDANQVQAQAEASGSTVDTAGVDSTDTHIARADSRASVGGLSTTSSVDEIMRALDARAAEISNERKKSERDIGGNDAKCYDCVALEILRDDYKALVLDNEQLTRENERMKQQMEALVTANKQLEQDMAAMKKDACDRERAPEAAPTTSNDAETVDQTEPPKGKGKVAGDKEGSSCGSDGSDSDYSSSSDKGKGSSNNDQQMGDSEARSDDAEEGQLTVEESAGPTQQHTRRVSKSKPSAFVVTTMHQERLRTSDGAVRNTRSSMQDVARADARAHSQSQTQSPSTVRGPLHVRRHSSTQFNEAMLTRGRLSISEPPKTRDDWEMGNSCSHPGCTEHFSFSTRRHHCRMCAMSMCIQHANDFVSYHGIRRRQRVCKKCYTSFARQRASAADKVSTGPTPS